MDTQDTGPQKDNKPKTTPFDLPIHPSIPSALPGLLPVRQNLGIGRADLAGLCNVSREHIRKIETVGTRASVELQCKLIEILHCSYIDLSLDYFGKNAKLWNERKDTLKKRFAIQRALEIIKYA